MLKHLFQKAKNLAASLTSEDISVTKEDLLPLLGGTFQNERINFRSNLQGLQRYGAALEKLSQRIEAEAKKRDMPIAPFTDPIKNMARNLYSNAYTEPNDSSLTRIHAYDLDEAMKNRHLVQAMIVKMMKESENNKLEKIPAVEAVHLVYGLQRLSEQYSDGSPMTPIDFLLRNMTPPRNGPHYSMTTCLEHAIDAKIKTAYGHMHAVPGIGK